MPSHSHTPDAAHRAATPTRDAPLLGVAGLRTAFVTATGSLPVVDTVSFSINPGQTLGILGESGCGKSLLALSVIGLVPDGARIETGHVWWKGTDLVALPERSMNAIRGREIAMVFQDPVSSLNPTRRVGSQIGESLRRHLGLSWRAAERRTVELLEEVGIADARRRAQAYPHEFSGGMCQRAMLAMAIACEPRLLIADEPTTALDATIQAQILGLLDKLKTVHDLALIVISHDVGVISRVADQVAVMYAGEFVEVGPTAAVLERPEHPYTEALLEAVLRLDGADARRRRMRTIPGRPPDPRNRPLNCRFAPRCPHRDRDEPCTSVHPVLRELRPDHWVRSFHPASERSDGESRAHA